MKIDAESIDAYLEALPEDRRAALTALRDVINGNIDPKAVETLSYGMPGWVVPHSVYPDGYHCNPELPLPFANIASQKNHIALYLFGVHCDAELSAWLSEAWKATGKKLDMGKSCIRVKRLEDIPLEVVGEAFRRMPLDRFIEAYEAGRSGSAAPRKKAAPSRKTAKKAAPTKTSAKPAPAKKRAAVAAEPKKKAAKKTTKKAAASKTTTSDRTDGNAKRSR